MCKIISQFLFGFFITTRRLIEFSSNFKTLLQTDGTYKLLWQGFPVLLLGSSDAKKVFHTIGIAVCTRERKNDFAFLFKSIQIAREKLNLPKLPSSLNLMADAAGAITNGFRLAGFTGIRGMCWFHVTKALKSRLAKLNDDHAAKIRSDIHFLQLSQTPAIFDSASKLFLKKWRHEQKDEQEIDFLNYFEQEWLIAYPNWFEGYSHPNNVGAPSTNNGNESINGVIKKENTFRELLSLGHFHVVTFRMITKFSKLGDPNNPNRKPFASIMPLSGVGLTPWTDAYNWKSGVEVLISNGKYYVQSTENKSIKIDDSIIEAYDKLMASASFTDFKQFYSTAFGFYCITMPENLNNSNRNMHVSSLLQALYL